MFCRACGSDIGNAKKCPNCGYNANKDASLNPQVKEDKILVTVDEVKKFELLKIGLYALVLILGLSLLFLPICKASEPESLEELVILVAKVEEKGNANFSYYDETVMIFEQLFNEYSTISLHTLFNSNMWFFGILIVFFITFVVQGLCGIIKSVKAINNAEKTRIAYSLHVDAFPKGKVIEVPLLLNVWIAMIGVVWDRWNPFGKKILCRSFGSPSFFDFSNCLPGFWMIILLFVGILALKIYINGVDTVAQKTVSIRRKQRRERNKEENQKAHQKYLERQKEKEAKQFAQEKNSNDREDASTTKQEETNNQIETTFNETKVENDKASVPTSANSNVSSADELLKYKSLLDQGIITQEEFDAKKKQLLGL